MKNDFYRALFYSLPMPFFIADENGAIILANPSYVELNSPLTLEEIKLINVFTDEGIQKSGLTLLIQNCLDLNTILFLEKELILPAQGKRYYSYCARPLLIRGKRLGVLCLIEDLTERKSNEIQQRQDHKMSTLGTLAAGIAHELNTPLGFVRLACESIISNLSETPPDIEMSHLQLERMIKSIDRMTDIIKQVMRFSKGNHIGKYDFFNLNSLIEETLLMYGKILRSSDIVIDLQLEKNLPLFYGNPNNLQTVLTDLINNSKDAFEKITDERERKLLIKTEYQDVLNAIILIIEDNGVGIPNEIKDRIFEPFFTTKDVGEGFGLGLSVTYGIIKQHKGTIGLESELQKGTRFKLMFPAVSEEDIHV